MRMSRKRRAKAGRRLIGPAAKAAFLTAVRGGAALAAAAAESGFSLDGFYGARARDPVFRLAWIWALQLSAAGERLSAAPAEADGLDGASLVAPNNRRQLQRRRMRHVRFDTERKRIFLDRLAGSCDLDDAAAAAGIDRSTVYNHRRRDGFFAAQIDEALTTGYLALEAEAVRQRLAAQRRLRDERLPTGEVSREFDRVMKLLARWDRGPRDIGLRAMRPGRGRRWTFDEAIALLDRRLAALDVRSHRAWLEQEIRSGRDGAGEQGPETD